MTYFESNANCMLLAHADCMLLEGAEGAKCNSPAQRAGWRSGDQPSAESAKSNALAWRELVRLSRYTCRAFSARNIIFHPARAVGRAITSSAFSASENRLTAHRSYVSESSM